MEPADDCGSSWRSSERNADLDNRLGHALLTAGRLRGQLLAAGIQPDLRFAPTPDNIYLDASKDEQALVADDGTDDG